MSQRRRLKVKDEPITLERLERALTMAAYIVLRHGNKYAPILGRLEKEVENARRNDPATRARRILADYNATVGREPILFIEK